MQTEQTDQPNNAEPNPTELPAEPTQPINPPAKLSIWRRFRNWYGDHKKIAIPLSLLVAVLLVSAIPWTRYKAVGVVVKKDLVVEIVDSTSHSPVSGAVVSGGGDSSTTDGNGKAVLHLSSGYHSLLVSKKYYKDGNQSILVPILSQKNIPQINLEATGRQVKITAVNLITQKKLGNVDIKIADVSAKTDSGGVAVVVVPAGSTSQKATLHLEGYNDSEVTAKVSDSTIAENTFPLTPQGKVYFLSKRTGKLSVMKANLDGTAPEVVLAGTGKEHDYDTQLLTSPDLKYVALLARRNNLYPTPQLYIISTADDKLLSIDSGNVNFSMIGWSGDNLVYYLTRDNWPTWKSGKDKLKSYDAGVGKTIVLDQTGAAGNSSDSVYEYYSLASILGNQVFYAKGWTEEYDLEPSDLLNSKKNTVSTISADGQDHKLAATYPAEDGLQYNQHSPKAIYIWQQQADASTEKYFDYEIGSLAPKSIKLTNDQFYDAYPTYIASPSGQKTFWSESRDGKNSLFVGDQNGENAATIATLSEFNPNNWYTNNYLLVSKHDSELYIMDAAGGKPIKITDYESSYSGYYHG